MQVSLPGRKPRIVKQLQKAHYCFSNATFHTLGILTYMLITSSAPIPHTKKTPIGGNKHVKIITQQSITIVGNIYKKEEKE